MRLNRARFERLAEKAFAELPEEFRSLLYNVSVRVQDEPGPEADDMESPEELLGLYVGMTRDEMMSTAAGTYLPAEVVLYQRNLERGCRSEGELAAAIRTTLRHELAHHFGFSDEDLQRKWPEGA